MTKCSKNPLSVLLKAYCNEKRVERVYILPEDTFSVACQPLGKHCEAVGDLPTVIVTVGLINGLSHLNQAASGNFGWDADKGYDK
jgi:hypothetical protein